MTEWRLVAVLDTSISRKTIITSIPLLSSSQDFVFTTRLKAGNTSSFLAEGSSPFHLETIK